MGLYRRTPTSNWIAEYVDASGKRQRVSTKTTSKTVAQKILDQHKIDAANQRFGITPTKATIGALLDEYIAYLANSGSKHQADCRYRIERVIAATEWSKASQITQYQTEIVIRQFPSVRDNKPLSLRSQGHYLTAMKSFTKWLTNVRGVLPRDPLAGIKKPNFAADRKRVRRFLLPEEWSWLRQTPNALLYETAIETGLRASELLRLGPSNLKDDRLVLSAKHTKNKRNANQYITKTLRAKLVGNLPFHVPDENRLAELLRHDLAIARWFAANSLEQIPLDFLQPENAEGHVLDFHSLRHTCGAWLAIAGVNPKVIQSIMRHSTITLTLDTYGHLMPGAEQDAVQLFDKLLR